MHTNRLKMCVQFCLKKFLLVFRTKRVTTVFRLVIYLFAVILACKYCNTYIYFSFTHTFIIKVLCIYQIDRNVKQEVGKEGMLNINDNTHLRLKEGFFLKQMIFNVRMLTYHSYKMCICVCAWVKRLRERERNYIERRLKKNNH